jgi:hypothetical protein
MYNTQSNLLSGLLLPVLRLRVESVPGFLKFEANNSEILYVNVMGAGIAQSRRLATGWTVRESNPVRGEIFRTCPDRPWGQLSLLYNEYRVFPWGKTGGAWCWPPTSSKTEVKRVYSYTSSPSGISSLLWGTFGACGGAVVAALRYKPEGRGIDYRWCHWNFSLT